MAVTATVSTPAHYAREIAMLHQRLFALAKAKTEQLHLDTIPTALRPKGIPMAAS